MADNREPKPDWESVPPALRTALAASFAATVTEARIAWGGYSPAASWIITLSDGRKLFVKGAHGGQTAHGKIAFDLELAVYRRTPQLEKVAPRFLGSWSEGEWSLLALEAIDPALPALPWTEEKIRVALTAFYRLGQLGFEGLTAAEDEPQLAALFRGEEGWARFESEQRLESLLLHFQEPEKLRLWITTHLPQLKALEKQTPQLGGPRQPLHLDLRSDNILFRADGRAVLLDWPNLCFGPIIYDLVYFINGITADDGPAQEQSLKLAEAIWETSFSREDQIIALANLSGFLALRGSKEEVSFMPRLRTLQRRHLQAALGWLSRLWKTPEAFELRNRA
jgi:hypothetical protein